MATLTEGPEGTSPTTPRAIHATSATTITTTRTSRDDAILGGPRCCLSGHALGGAVVPPFHRIINESSPRVVPGVGKLGARCCVPLIAHGCAGAVGMKSFKDRIAQATNGLRNLSPRSSAGASRAVSVASPAVPASTTPCVNHTRAEAGAGRAAAGRGSSGSTGRSGGSSGSGGSGGGNGGQQMALKKGELMKRREHLKTWTRRLFALTSTSLVYYVPDDIRRPKVWKRCCCTSGVARDGH